MALLVIAIFNKFIEIYNVIKQNILIIKYFFIIYFYILKLKVVHLEYLLIKFFNK